MPINENQRSALRWIALVVAACLFACAWFITYGDGNEVFGSTNYEAFRAAGMFMFAISFVP